MEQPASTNLGGFDRTRSNNVRCHSVGSIFDSNGVRERINAGLSNTNVGLERCATVVKGGTDKDNSTAGAKGRGLN